MAARRPVARLLERLVLPQLRPLLPPGEQILAWAHVMARDDGTRGILILTAERCVAHWPNRSDVVVPWEGLVSARLEPGAPGQLVLVLAFRSGDVAVRLSATSRAQIRKAVQLLRTIGRAAPPGALGDLADSRTGEFPVQRRGVRGHVRRAAVTTAGVFLLLLGLAFASPFLPGPGYLTILAGLALLASEYDWAKDLHHWLRSHFDRLRRRLRARLERRRERSR